jgi:hypothetical protein
MTGYKSKRAAAQAKTIDKVNWVDHETNGVAQPAQEPVAWITPDGEGFRIRFSPPTNEVPLGWDALYTTPPQRPWVGLEGEEIRYLWEEATKPDRSTMTMVTSFAKDIEAKLKEKNT